MHDAIVIHTDEISLKGGNRDRFEQALVKNVRARLVGRSFVTSRRKGSIVMRPAEPFDDDGREAVREALRRTFGIAHFTLSRECPKNAERIMEMGAELMAGRTGTFRVTAKRGDKRFGLSSMELARQLGGAVLAGNGDLKVDLHAPDHTLYVEVSQDGAFLSVGREDGPGGLPTGTNGKVAVLLSGGIDSPVAAYRVMSRGCRAEFVHFHSYPHVGRESIEKVRRLADILDLYQLRSVMHSVPFADIQREITAKTDGAMRVVLYRRFMLRIAEAIAGRSGALGLVTGDSIGQVASQTLENLATVSAATTMPVYRPLVGDGKIDIIRIARRIGTYETSIEPHDDCCTLFVPEHPELRSTVAQAEAEEAKLDVEALIAAALEKTETETIK